MESNGFNPGYSNRPLARIATEPSFRLERYLCLVKGRKAYESAVVSPVPAVSRSWRQLLYYILIFRDGSALEIERDASLLNKYIEEIGNRRIFEQMEKYLEIEKR